MPTVMIDGKKHTPGSNTLKKMKRKAAAEAAAKANKPATDKPKGKKKTKAKEKPPIPAKRSMKHKVKVPQGAVVDVKKLKGKVSDLPSKKKPITKGGRTGDMTKAGAQASATYIKMRKQLGTGK